jgi:hypothetical protein
MIMIVTESLTVPAGAVTGPPAPACLLLESMRHLKFTQAGRGKSRVTELELIRCAAPSEQVVQVLVCLSSMSSVTHADSDVESDRAESEARTVASLPGQSRLES